MPPAILVLMMLVLGAPALSQLSPAEAEAKLKERQADKEVARSEKVEITRGELDDLNATIAQLKAEITILRQQLPLPAAKPAAAKRPTKIELGMTRDALVTFVKAHPKYRVARFGAMQSTPVTVDGKALTRKAEIADIEITATRQVVVGQHKDVLGHWQDDYDMQSYVTTTMRVELQDDIITSIIVE
jgi:hypothetical protein